MDFEDWQVEDDFDFDSFMYVSNDLIPSEIFDDDYNTSFIADQPELKTNSSFSMHTNTIEPESSVVSDSCQDLDICMCVLL